MKDIYDDVVRDDVEDEYNDDDSAAKPLKKGKALFTSGFVMDIQYCDDNIYYYVRAHSMKNNLPLNDIITMSKQTGFINLQLVHVKPGHSRDVHTLLLYYFTLKDESG